MPTLELRGERKRYAIDLAEGDVEILRRFYQTHHLAISKGLRPHAAASPDAAVLLDHLVGLALRCVDGAGKEA